MTCYRFISLETEKDLVAIQDGNTGAAWLSSARAVRCSLKWGNERNPHPMLNIHWRQPRVLRGEEGGEDVKSARPLCPGLHTHYNGEKQWVASRQRQANPSNFASVQIEG